MTADRRDWSEYVCGGCGLGMRGTEANANIWLANHSCPANSGEEKKPECLSPACWRECEDEDMCLQASHSPSNALLGAERSRLYPETPERPTTIEYGSGVRRTPKEGKVNYSLVLDGPLIQRLAEHLTKGEESHGKRNWMKANTEEDLERFRESAVRHFFQWYFGVAGEDHFAATVFNMNGAEEVKPKLREELPDPDVTGFA